MGSAPHEKQADILAALADQRLDLFGIGQRLRQARLHRFRRALQRFLHPGAIGLTRV